MKALVHRWGVQPLDQDREECPMSALAGFPAYSSHTGPERVGIYESSLQAGFSAAGQTTFPAGEGLGAVLPLWVGWGWGGGTPGHSPSLVLCYWDAHVSSVFRDRMSLGSSGGHRHQEAHFSGASSLILKLVSVSIACYLLNRDYQTKW